MDDSHEPPADASTPETASSAPGRYRIGARFLGYLSATWCGSVLFVIGTLFNASAGGSFSEAVTVPDDVATLKGMLLADCTFGLFSFVLGIAFGRFLLRAMPPHLLGRTRRRQLAIITVAIGAALIDLLRIRWYWYSADARRQTPTWDHRRWASQRSAALFVTILWGTGAVGPLVLRHRGPRAFLDVLRAVPAALLYLLRSNGYRLMLGQALVCLLYF